MEIINAILSYVDLMFSSGAVWAILYAMVILVIAVFIGIYMASYTFRALGLLALAGVTYLMTPLAVTQLARLYFESLILEFIGAFAVLLLFDSFLTESRGTFAPLTAFVIIAASIFLAGAPFIPRSLSIEIAVMLLGSYLTTVLLKREWWWEASKPGFGYRREIDTGLQDEVFAEQLADAELHLKLIGKSAEELESKLELLRQSLIITGHSEPERDKRGRQFVQYVAAQIREDVHVPKMPPQGHVNLRINGEVNLVQKAVLRVKEVFDVTNSVPRDGARRGEMEAHVQCAVPELGLGDALFEHFRDLAVNLRGAAQKAESQAGEETGDSRKKAFYQGFARAAQQAASQLVTKLDDLGLTN